MSAWSMVAMAAFGSLAVDLSSFYYQRRNLQSATDLAAIAAAGNLAEAQNAAIETLALNGFSASSLTSLVFGVYTADPSIPVGQRFVPSSPSAANAVSVSTQIQSPLMLARVMSLLSSPSSKPCSAGQTCGQGSTDDGSEIIGARAVAAARADATFAIGSGLANLQGGVLNAVLGSMLGANLSLSLMNYQSLANANVDLFSFSNALATRVGLTAGTYSQVANANVHVGDVLSAISSSAPGAASALSSIIAAASATTLNLATVIDYGPYGNLQINSPSPIGASVSALDLLIATAQLANGTHQVQTSLALNAPPIASATLAVTIGERPVGQSFVTIGAAGASVHTAQTRLLLTSNIAIAGSTSLVTLPLYIEVASATATLSSITCPTDPANDTVALNATPGIVNAWVGAVTSADMTNFSTEPNPPAATLVTVPLVVSVTGGANAKIANLNPTLVTFSTTDIQNLTRKTTSTQDFIASLLANLFGNLNLQAQVLGLGVSLPGGPTQAVSQSLASAATPIDQTVASILSAMGVSLGNAYTWVSGVRCGHGALVN
jgi:uncharacterized membrane protein